MPLTTPERPVQPKVQVNQNFDTDQEVLEKELSLGKDLLKKAIFNLNDAVFRRLGEQSLNERETNVIRVFFSMISLMLDN